MMPKKKEYVKLKSVQEIKDYLIAKYVPVGKYYDMFDDLDTNGEVLVEKI